MLRINQLIGFGVSRGASGPTSWTFTTSHAPFSGSVAPTQANMSDGLATTYYAPNTGAASWAEADLGSSLLVTTVRIADAAGNGGWNETHLNGRTLQYWDGSTWVTAATLAGHLGTGNLITYSPSITAQRWRINSPSNWFAVSEFWFT